MADQPTNNDNSVVFVAEYRRAIVPPAKPECDTSDIICVGESAIVPQPRPVRDDATNNRQEDAAASLPPSNVRVDPDTPVVAEVNDRQTNTVTIISGGELPRTVQEQWAKDQAASKVDEERPDTMVYNLPMAPPQMWNHPTPTTCCGRFHLYCRCNVQSTSSDTRRRPTPYPERANDQAVGAVDESRPETLVYDLAMPAPATWEEPTPTTCCGQWAYYCRCNVQSNPSGTRRRPTPYPDRDVIAEVMERRETPTSVECDENDEPGSGRSTSLGDIMDWDPCCVTPEVEYTPQTSPFPGRPAKRRQLPLKPSLVEEVQPTEPSLPHTPEPTPCVNTEVQSTQIQVDRTVRVNPMTSCDGFRVRFSNGAHVIVTRIVLEGVNMYLSISSDDRVVLRFTPLATGQCVPTLNIPFNAPEASYEGATGAQLSCLTNFRVDLGDGCYAQVGGITLKGASIEKYDYEIGGVGLAFQAQK